MSAVKTSSGYDSLQEDIDANSTLMRKGPFRFRLGAGEERKIIFLDDAAFRFKEHMIRVNGEWGYTEPCTADDNGVGCPLCDAGNKPYYVGLWTVIDVNGFVDKKNGEHRKMVKTLFAAKSTVMRKLAKKSEKLREKGYSGGLSGFLLEVSRSDSKAFSTGDDFEVVGQVAPEKLVDSKGEPFKPYDYASIAESDPMRQRKLVPHAQKMAAEPNTYKK